MCRISEIDGNSVLGEYDMHIRAYALLAYKSRFSDSVVGKSVVRGLYMCEYDVLLGQDAWRLISSQMQQRKPENGKNLDFEDARIVGQENNASIVSSCYRRFSLFHV